MAWFRILLQEEWIHVHCEEVLGLDHFLASEVKLDLRVPGFVERDTD